ncbi:MAG: polysialyltransferase family glycosyltransferase [Bacteroidaceae bacterium]|jgi:hypothetical protein|nr:polysialyltransferase family glycosyltransferase [Bacteroidaceae bacterium]
MKHIFVVHSPITYLSSLGVIISEKINLTDVLFISSGFNLDGPIKIKIVDISANKTPTVTGILKNLRIFYDRGYYLNLTINNFIKKDKFIAYISVFNNIERFTVIHPNCLNFNFIEEGVEAYHTSHSLSHYSISYKSIFYYKKGFKGLIQRIKSSIRRFGYTEAVTTIPIFSIAYQRDNNKKFYCYSEESYPFAMNKKILDFTLIKNKFFLSLDFTDYNEISGQYIWIGNVDMFKNNLLYQEFLNMYLLKFIQKEKINKLYIRFHYRESKEQKQILIDFFNINKIEYKILPDKTIMELLLLNVPHCNCIGFNSSLLLYAAYMGHNSISFGNQKDAKKEIRYPTFKKYVRLLDNDYFE